MAINPAGENKGLSIIMVGSEETTVAKQGGAADVTHDLPEAWQKLGHRVVRFLPYHGVIKPDSPYPIEDLNIVVKGTVHGREEFAKLFLLKQNDGVDTILFANTSMFERSAFGYLRPYDSPLPGVDGGQIMKYAFFTTLIAPAAKAIAEQRPDIIGNNVDVFVLNDWMPMPFTAHHASSWREDKHIGNAIKVAILHNVGDGYRGDSGNVDILTGIGLTMQMRSAFLMGERADWFTFLGGGLSFADGAVTVSPSYRDESLLREYSSTLSPQLNMMHSLGRYIGILNGGDYEYWDPTVLHAYKTARGVPYRSFSAEDMSGKDVNKALFLDEHNIMFDPKNPPLVAGFNSRMADQKAPDVLASHIPYMIEKYGWVIVVQGQGEQKYVELFRDLKKRYPNNIIDLSGSYSDDMAKIVRGATDVEFITSRYEPCGLSDVQAMAYGAIPIVTGTGGLKDKVEAVVDSESLRLMGPAEIAETGITGFVVNSVSDSASFREQIDNANYIYSNPKLREQMRLNAINERFTWDSSAATYITFFKGIMEMNEGVKRGRVIIADDKHHDVSGDSTESGVNIKELLLSGEYAGVDGRIKFAMEVVGKLYNHLRLSFDDVLGIAKRFLNEEELARLNWTDEQQIPEGAVLGLEYAHDMSTGEEADELKSRASRSRRQKARKVVNAETLASVRVGEGVSSDNAIASQVPVSPTTVNTGTIVK